MKKIILVLVLVCTLGFAEAQSFKKNAVLQRGYRGFVENVESVNMDGDLTIYSLGLTTSHGYQFSPYFFLGAGLGVQYYYFDLDDVFTNFMGISNDFTCMPLFVHARGTFMRNWVTPYADLKIGTSFTHGESLFYANPSVGARFGFSPKFGLNVGLGYSYLGKVEMNSISVHIGIDF